MVLENPNTHLIKRIITDLVNKLSDDPREQRLQKMGHYRDMLFSDYIEYLFGEGLKPYSVKHHRFILSCIFTRAVEQELFEYNFINNLKPIKSDHYIGNFYKHEELLHLFEIAENTTIRLEVIIAMDETNKEVSAQVLVAKFQYILTNYNENEIYEMENQTLNNIYEDIDNSSQFKDMKKVVATVQNQQQLI